jgi:hypothetical protein
MKTYRIWLSKNLYEDVEAECPCQAIEKTGCKYIWRIEEVNICH